MAKVIRKLDPDWRVSNNGTYRPRREFFIAEIQCFTFRPLARGHRQQLFKNACATLFYRLEPIKERAAGERFHFEARDLLRRAEDAKVIARSVASGHLGNVSLAFLPIATVPIVPVIATKLAKELPDIRIVLNEMMTGEQVERLRTGRVDIGILRRPDSNLPGEQKLLLREPYRLAVHRDHPFATRADLTIQDLDEQDLLMYSRATVGTGTNF